MEAFGKHAERDGVVTLFSLITHNIAYAGYHTGGCASAVLFYDVRRYSYLGVSISESLLLAPSARGYGLGYTVELSSQPTPHLSCIISCKQKPDAPYLPSSFLIPFYTFVSSNMRLFPLIVYLAVAVAQQDPIQDFCRRHQHQTCVIDDKLYIDGGKVYYGVSVENDSSSQQSKLIAAEHIDLAD